MKGILKGYLSCQTDIQKGKGFDLRAEPSHTKLSRVPPQGCKCLTVRLEDFCKCVYLSRNYYD